MTSNRSKIGEHFVNSQQDFHKRFQNVEILGWKFDFFARKDNVILVKDAGWSRVLIMDETEAKQVCS